MANTKSAEKQARVSARRRVINQSLLSRTKKVEKKIRTLVSEGKKDDAAKLVDTLYSAIDKAAKKKTVHRNKASRTKARIAKLVKK